jgi:phosphoglycerol transferase
LWIEVSTSEEKIIFYLIVFSSFYFFYQMLVLFLFSISKTINPLIRIFQEKVRKRFLFLIIINIVFIISFLIYQSSNWVISTFGDVNIEQLIYQAKNLEGTDQTFVWDFLAGPLLTTLFAQAIFFPISLFFATIAPQNKLFRFSTNMISIVSVCLIFLSMGVQTFGYIKFINYFSDSNFIEDNYVSPSDVNIEFTANKRNLIYIFVESLEGTYTNRASGGIESTNLLEPLTVMAEAGAINFSNTENIGGALQLPGMQYTAGAIVAQTSGMPIKTAEIDANNFGTSEAYQDSEQKFLPGITALGDILKDNGYYNVFMMGSDASFGGRRSYLESHGDYEIIDLNEVKERGWLPEDYHIWWGYEDKKLFDFAKQELETITVEERPFNFTLLTADTHHPEGLLYEDTPIIEDDQFKSVVAFSAQMIADFVTWCQTQSWYDNTTIVISGDHLSMNQDYAKKLSENYTRTVFDLFINTAHESVSNEIIKNRQYSNMDIFPTVLSSLGATIEGEQLGLGVNLFSGEKTLIEKNSLEYVTGELEKRSKFYTEEISGEGIQGTSSE